MKMSLLVFLLIPLFLSLSFSLSALESFALEPPYLKDLSVKQKGLSSELEIMVDQISSSKSLNFNEAQEVVNAAKIANADLSKAPKSNALFLIKSEIYKSLLNTSLLPQKSRLSLSSSLLKSVAGKLKKHKLIYGPFSSWTMESVQSELAPYLQDGLIDKYQSVSGNDIKERTRALELERLAKYLGPWIIEFLDRTPEDFNKLTDQIAVSSIKSLARKGFYFAKFSNNYSRSMGEEIFSVPSLKRPTPGQGPAPADKNLKDIKQERLKKGQKDVEQLRPVGENPSGAIDQLLESTEKAGPNTKKKAWKPR